jgi:hypothetical protein
MISSCVEVCNGCDSVGTYSYDPETVEPDEDLPKRYAAVLKKKIRTTEELAPLQGTL